MKGGSDWVIVFKLYLQSKVFRFCIDSKYLIAIMEDQSKATLTLTLAKETFYQMELFRNLRNTNN